MPNHGVERVVPTGHVFLIFELDGMPRHTFDPRTLQPNATFTRAWISGMHRGYLSISAHKNSSMLVVQFKAGGALPFLQVPLAGLNEQVIPAEQILGETVLRLRDQLLAAADSAARFALIDDWLRQRHDPAKAPPADLIAVIADLQSEAVGHYRQVVERYPHSAKHLIEQFKKYVGQTPKTYQRIIRFNEILQQVHQQERIEWTDIAYRCGYADQSHFIKEFRRFSGFNPRQFLREDHHKSVPNFFPLGRAEPKSAGG